MNKGPKANVMLNLWQNGAMLMVYGISNCDTVRQARAWLADHGLAYEFHDYKKHRVPAQKLLAWEKAVGWEKLLNRQGTTWRKLEPNVQSATVDAASAMVVMQAHPSVIKRPVVEWDGQVSVGLDTKSWAARL